jgi:tetratricopeptide (TPR) repeat protein
MQYAVLGLVLATALLALWLAFGPGPRRRRASRRAQRLLGRGKWSDALAVVREVQTCGRHSPAWAARLRELAGDCHQRGADEALQDRRFEDALRESLEAAELHQQDPAEARGRVVDRMLAEARKLFASGTGPAETDAVLQLLARTQAVQSPCPEALFWEGLCRLCTGDTDAAQASLTAAFQGAGKQFLDPAFYLGVLRHRLGQPQEALRHLADANRVDPGCPFVTWQMGLSLVAAGGDAGLAARALQRALGPRGFELWAKAPERAWVEAFPEAHSYVRRLASRHRYVCPLLGGDLATVVRQGRIGLAQALYRQGNFQESADLFTKLLQDSPPTPLLLRGLGLALARLERYDQAYTALKQAWEGESPKDPFTSAYFALSVARGKPPKEEDRPRNVTWALRLLARFPAPGNAEWAGLCGAVHAEARAVGLEVPAEDQLLLCDALASVRAADPQAAAAYRHLAATHPDAVRLEHAWLFTRSAAASGGPEGDNPADLALFARTFGDPGPARDYFDKNGWSFDDAEYAYLARGAALAPGRFPEALGGDYAPRGERFLLERSRREEEAGRADAALACAEVLLRLAPQSVAGHDRLACLYHRRGDAGRAAALLEGWQRLAPADPWPLVRQAVLEEQRGNASRRAEAIDRALGLTRGPVKAAVAFLGARLALRSGVKEWGPAASADKALANGSAHGPPGEAHPPALADARSLLERCLEEQPDHVEALWCLAAVRSVTGDRAGLAAQAPAMDRPEVPDAQFHYLGAVCQLAAGDHGRALELGRRAAADAALAAEGEFVMAWAHLHRGEGEAARAALERVAAADGSPSAPYARALLGRLAFGEGRYADASGWWTATDPRRRAAWGLDDPLRQTVLLAGLLDYEGGRFEQAADRFREAGRLGLRDRRLGPLLTLALVKAGQRLLYDKV